MTMFIISMCDNKLWHLPHISGKKRANWGVYIKYQYFFIHFYSRIILWNGFLCNTDVQTMCHVFGVGWVVVWNHTIQHTCTCTQCAFGIQRPRDSVRFLMLGSRNGVPANTISILWFGSCLNLRYTEYQYQSMFKCSISMRNRDALFILNFILYWKSCNRVECYIVIQKIDRRCLLMDWDASF